jgi:hypothetical protein
MNGLYQLWKLRQYLALKRDAQTVFVKFDGLRGPECLEFGFTDDYSLGDSFKQLGYSPPLAQSMVDIGLNPMKYGTVYAYIERRSPVFVPLYGWGVDR